VPRRTRQTPRDGTVLEVVRARQPTQDVDSAWSCSGLLEHAPETDAQKQNAVSGIPVEGVKMGRSAWLCALLSDDNDSLWAVHDMVQPLERRALISSRPIDEGTQLARRHADAGSCGSLMHSVLIGWLGSTDEGEQTAKRPNVRRLRRQ
jgi:hypothetical protein